MLHDPTIVMGYGRIDMDIIQSSDEQTPNEPLKTMDGRAAGGQPEFFCEKG